MSRLLCIAVMLIALSLQSNAHVSHPILISAGKAESLNTSTLVYNIRLQLTKVSDGVARLHWTYNPGNFDNFFVLIRTDTFGNSNTIYSGPDSTYTDIITFPYCDSNYLSYRVEIKGINGSSSNIESDFFLDDNIPADAIMDSVSIDPVSGHPIVSWVPSSSSDVAGYEIQQKLGGAVWELVGFAPGSLTTSFIPDTMNACAVIKTFAVITRDQCSNRSTGVGTYPKALNTLLLGPPDVNECAGTAVLNWNSYNNMTPALGGYQVFRKEGIKPDSLIGTTTAGVTTYTDMLGFTKGARYSYYVRAISQDGMKSSTSCKQWFISKRPLGPDIITLNYVTVINSRYVELGFEFGPVNTVQTIRILRSVSGNGIFDTIALLSPGNLGVMTFEDTTAEVNKQSYYYKIDAVDSCDVALTSERARTIYLTCLSNPDESNSLSWNDYEGWPGGIGHYEVYRFVNNIPDAANPIYISTQGNTSYTDHAWAILQAGNIISYQVEAFGKSGPVAVTSLSNIVMAMRQPLIMVPNAFAPRGINRVFRPKMLYVENANYKMLIFNKWGQQIFNSSDPEMGWDGKQNGEFVPVDVYFYRLEYSSFNGKIFNKTGSVIVVQ